METVAIVVAAALAVLLVVRELAWRRAIRVLRDRISADRIALREQTQMAHVGQLVSGMAQELKSPLQGVIGNTELMVANSGIGIDSHVEIREIQEHVARAAGTGPAPHATAGRAPAAVTLATRRGDPDDRLLIELDDRTTTELDELDEPSWSGDLVACRQIVQAHGGSLEIVRPANGGYRFHLELPVTAAGADPLHATL